MHISHRHLIALVFLFPATLRANPPEITLTGHSGPVLDVAFSRDGARLASVGDDGKLKLWDIAGKKELFSCDGLKSSGNNVRFTPDGKSIVAIGSSSDVAVIDAATGKARSIPLTEMIGGAAALDLSPDGTTIAIVGRGKLRLLDLATGAAKADYVVHSGYGVTAVAFSADGKLIATAGTDSKACIVDAATGKILQTLKLSINGVAIALSQDGKTLYVSTTDQVLQSFDVASGTARTLVDVHLPVLKLYLSGDGKTLAVAGIAHGPWLLSLPEGKRSEAVFDSGEWVKSGATSSDSRWVAGGGNQGSVFIWKN